MPVLAWIIVHRDLKNNLVHLLAFSVAIGLLLAVRLTLAR